MILMNQKLVKIKIRITYKPSVSNKFIAQSYPSSHFILFLNEKDMIAVGNGKIK